MLIKKITDSYHFYTFAFINQKNKPANILDDTSAVTCGDITIAQRGDANADGKDRVILMFLNRI